MARDIHGKSIVLAVTALILGIAVALSPYALSILRTPREKYIAITSSSPYPSTSTSQSTVDTQTQTTTIPSVYGNNSFYNLLNYMLRAKNVGNILQSFALVENLALISRTVPSVTTPLPLLSVTYSQRQRVSETNIQVVGVDEPDIVKTNGRFIVFASGSRVYIVDAKDRGVVSVLDFQGDVRGVLLKNNTLVVLTCRYTVKPIIFDINSALRVFIPSDTVNTSITVVNLENAKDPKIELNIVVTGDLLDARRVDNRVYIVINQGIDFNFVNNNTLPIPIVNGQPINIDKIHIVDQVASSYVNIVIVDIDNLQYNVESFLISSSTRIYMTPQRLYIVSDEIPYTEFLKKIIEKALMYLPKDLAEKVYEHYVLDNISGAFKMVADYLKDTNITYATNIVNEINKAMLSIIVEKVKVYIFDVKGLSIALKGVVEAPGKLLDQFAIEEVGNTIVLATTYWGLTFKLSINVVETPKFIDASDVEITICNTTGCYKKYLSLPKEEGEDQEKAIYIVPQIISSGETENNVYIFDVNTLQLLGKLEGLAKGERVYAARVVKNIVFLVTFREVDPLFAIDIEDPRNPKVLGYLKIPGFSEYLHPISNDTLLGVGLEGSDLKISLFDVSNPMEMKEISKIYIKNSYSEVLQNHRALTIDNEFKRIFIPITVLWRRNGIAVIEIKNFSLSLNTILFHEGSRRAIFINDELYVVSPKSIKVYNYWTLEEIYEIPLPQ